MILYVSNKNDHASSDVRIDEWFESVKNQIEVPIATECQLTRLRIAHLHGDIHIDYIVTDCGVHILVDKEGMLSEWPDGFFNVRDRLLSELLGWSYEETSNI